MFFLCVRFGLSYLFRCGILLYVDLFLLGGVSDFLIALLFAFVCTCFLVYYMCSNVGLAYVGVFFVMCGAR